MLNGHDPLLIIILKHRGPILPFTSTVTPGLIDVLDSFIPGIPIPIYLSERVRFGPSLDTGGGSAVGLTGISGIYIDNESKSIDVQTRVESTTQLDPITLSDRTVEVTQRAVGSALTINMIASRESAAVTVLTILMDNLLKRLVSKEYEIHYFNGPICIFGALLDRFATSVDRNTDLLRMELTLSTVPRGAVAAATGKATIQAIPRNQAAIPLG